MKFVLSSFSCFYIEISCFKLHSLLCLHAQISGAPHNFSKTRLSVKLLFIFHALFGNCFGQNNRFAPHLLGLVAPLLVNSVSAIAINVKSVWQLTNGFDVSRNVAVSVNRTGLWIELVRIFWMVYFSFISSNAEFKCTFYVIFSLAADITISYVKWTVYLLEYKEDWWFIEMLNLTSKNRNFKRTLWTLQHELTLKVWLRSGLSTVRIKIWLWCTFRDTFENSSSTSTSVVSGGSRISPGGAPNPHGAPTYDFAKFSRKLHEIKRIWAPREGGGGGAHPWRPAKSATGSYQHITSNCR